MIPKKKSTTKSQKDKDKLLNDLIEKATTVVDGYERYLLNTLNYSELARLMQDLRSILPISKKDDDDKE